MKSNDTNDLMFMFNSNKMFNDDDGTFHRYVTVNYWCLTRVLFILWYIIRLYNKDINQTIPF